MNMFSRNPIRMIDGMYDFIGDYTDDYIVNYDEVAEGVRDWQHLRFETSIVSNCCEVAIRNCFPSQESHILDVGCGWGEIIGAVPVKNKVALDISLVRLKEVNPSIVRIRADAEDIPLVSEQFNFVILTEIFEHVKNVDKLVNEVRRLLYPRGYCARGGMLLLTTPWEQDISIYDSPEYLNKYKRYKYSHLRSVNQRLIDDLFGEHFKLVAETEITAHEIFMELKPYSIKFFQFERII